MEHLDCPGEIVWDERRLWFEEKQRSLARAGVSRVSEQATALMIELQAVFSAGAWVACIVLAMTIVEAQIRTHKSLTWIDPKDLRWLQILRNKLVHEKRDSPGVTVEDHWLRRDLWEERARRAVAIALASFYPPAQPVRRA